MVGSRAKASLINAFDVRRSRRFPIKGYKISRRGRALRNSVIRRTLQLPSDFVFIHRAVCSVWGPRGLRFSEYGYEGYVLSRCVASTRWNFQGFVHDNDNEARSLARVIGELGRLFLSISKGSSVFGRLR